MRSPEESRLLRWLDRPGRADRLPGMPTLHVAGYLQRLGLGDAVTADIDTLRVIHAAHVERVAYEVLWIWGGQAATITTNPYEAAERIVAHRRGGYCYHLNGALSLLLSELGFNVVWHRAGVQNLEEPDPPGADRANHLALTVHGLPSDDNPAGDWFVDVGLGDALHEPLPLREGVYEQGPFRYELHPSETEPGGWRFVHDPRGSFAGMDFRPSRATEADFTERHTHLSTSPESGFLRVCTVQRRDATGVDILRGCVLSRMDGAMHSDKGGGRTLETSREWYEALAEVFGLPMADASPKDRDKLWQRVRHAHDAWLAGRT
jgi:N-hydroxyarylamine O-acetyltransferase